MKHLLIIFILLIIVHHDLFSQRFNLKELIALKQSNIADAEDYLVNRNWKITKTRPPSDSTLGLIIFEPETLYKNIMSFIHYNYYDYSGHVRLSFNLIGTDAYTNFTNELKTTGIKLIKTEIHDKGLDKYYRGKTLTFLVSTWIGNESNTTTTSYFICIYSNEDFDKNHQSVKNN